MLFSYEIISETFSNMMSLNLLIYFRLLYGGKSNETIAEYTEKSELKLSQILHKVGKISLLQVKIDHKIKEILNLQRQRS